MPKASRETEIVIEWVGGTSEQVLMVEIRNRGTTPVDVSEFSLGDDVHRCVLNARVESLRGSLVLPPGALALVATSPLSNTNDEPRAKYQYLYRAVNQDGCAIDFPGLNVALFDTTGALVDGGEVDEDDPIGLCCIPTASESACTSAAPPCDGTVSATCWAQVRQSECCKPSALNACCFKESTSQYCPTNSCSGTGWTRRN